MRQRVLGSGFASVALVLSALLAGSPGVAAADDKTPGAGAGADGFAARLYDQLRHTRGNLCFSPASLRMALAMTYAGARGETATQLRLGLGLPDGNAAHVAMDAKRVHWQVMSTPSGETLYAGRRLWSEPGLPIAPAYAALIADRYGVPPAEVDLVHDVDGRRAIDDWVSDATAHFVPTLPPRPALDPATRLVLVDAAYFQSHWRAPVPATETRLAPFAAAGHVVQTPFMHAQLPHGYAAIAGGQVLETWLDSNFIMDIVLPADSNGLDALEQQLVDGALPSWRARVHIADVDVTLPRFRATARLSVKPLLQAMGLTLPFDERRADFSGIARAPRVHLDDVVHQAVVVLDAPAPPAAPLVPSPTGITIVDNSYYLGEKVPTPEHVVFRADHPFLYVIREYPSGEILFVGRLADPSVP